MTASDDVVADVVPVFPVDEAAGEVLLDAAAVAVPVVVVVAEGAVVLVVLVVLVVVEPAATAVNVTVTAIAVRSRPSDVSLAVYFTDSAVESLTAKVAIPLLFVVAFVLVTVEAPPDLASVTAFPDTGSPLPS